MHVWGERSCVSAFLLPFVSSRSHSGVVLLSVPASLRLLACFAFVKLLVGRSTAWVLLPREKLWVHSHLGVTLNYFYCLRFLSQLPRCLSGKEYTCQFRRHGYDSWIRKIPWRRKWQSTPVFLPGKFHGQGSLEGYSPQSCKESDMTEELTSQLRLWVPGGQSSWRRVWVPKAPSLGERERGFH